MKIAFLYYFIFLFGVSIAGRQHSFKRGEDTPVFTNIVGPYKNPTETYGFYEKLPFCKPSVLIARIETLGEVLEGNRLTNSIYEIKFQEKISKKEACVQTYSVEDVETFKKAIDENYYFQIFIDDLPVWNFIGFKDGAKYYLYTHYFFNLEYNDDKIVSANVTVGEMSEYKTLLPSAKLPIQLHYYYSVNWNKNTDIKFGDRLHQLTDNANEDEIETHWFSILNSVVLVLLLTGFLALILVRILKSDYKRYSIFEEQTEEVEEFGWKLVYADVFRFPNKKAWLSSVLGVGVQFGMIFAGVLALGGVGLYYPYNRGSMKTSVVILYAITSFFSGYISASFYKKIGGDKWVWNIVLTSTIFALPLFIVWSILNSIAWSYQSSQALPFGTIAAIFLIWLLFGFPLTLLGGIIGKNRAGEFEAPCRTRNIPREIPPSPWYHSTFFQVCLAGFLPFSAISIELYYIFGTLWGHRLYSLYGILLIIFSILLIVTSFITVSLVYFQLSAENYHWWWRSILNGGSASFFIFGYSIFYFVKGSSMSGLLQVSFFFGYMFIVCYTIFLMLGAIGFFSSLTFIRYIYKHFRTE